MDALLLRCVRCGVVDLVPEDAYVAMGEPSLEQLGWHELPGSALELECDDCHADADAAQEPPEGDPSPDVVPAPQAGREAPLSAAHALGLPSLEAAANGHGLIRLRAG